VKVIFAGTPEFAANVLQKLLESEHEVIAVYTQPDRPAGRGRKLTASPVKAFAQKHRLAVYQPKNLKDNAVQQTLESLSADIMIVVAYGLLLPQAVLQAPEYGCLNIHASILPRWRGAAPIQRAILQGDTETGVTIMQMDEGLDTGDILNIVRCPIDRDDTGSSLHDKLADMGTKVMLQTLTDITADRLTPEQQDDSQAIYAQKLDKKEARIDWQHDAQTIVHKIQAFNSWPVAHTFYRNQPIRFWRAQFIASQTAGSDFCLKRNGFKDNGFKKNGSEINGKVINESAAGLDIAAKGGIVRILELQLPGKKRILARDFINGQSLLGVTFPDVQ
jgi:methionyl-tRNA formyltransferase